MYPLLCSIVQEIMFMYKSNKFETILLDWLDVWTHISSGAATIADVLKNYLITLCFHLSAIHWLHLFDSPMFDNLCTA